MRLTPTAEDKKNRSKLIIGVFLMIVLLGYVGWMSTAPQTIQLGKFSIPRLKGWEEYSYGDNSKFQTQLRFAKRHRGTQITLWFIQWHVPPVTGQPTAFLSRLAASYQDTKKRLQQSNPNQEQPRTSVTRSQATQFRGWPAYVVEEQGEKLKRKKMDFIVNKEHYEVLMSIQGEQTPEALAIADEAWQELTSSAIAPE